MHQFKARDHMAIYEELGINLNTLGVAMLDFDADSSSEIHDDVEKADLTGKQVRSNDPERFWIDGMTDHDKLHVTIRYGLLPVVTEEHCREVLSDTRDHPDTDRLTGVLGVFDSPYEDLQYDCLVLKIDAGGLLLDMHNALGLLPNVATFSPPTFHVTLGYFEPGSCQKLRGRLSAVNATNFRLNFGKMSREDKK